MSLKNIALLCLLLVTIPGKRQNPAPPDASGELENVLTQMDHASMTFKSAEAEFEWSNYQKVVDETDKQKGRIYFRRTSKDIEAMFDITSPNAKQVLYKEGRILLYNPKIDEITEYAPEKSKSEVEAFLSLGFGAPGHDLLKSYDVKMVGWDQVDDVKTAKLQLTALLPKVRNMFSQFVLWIDPQRDVPLKQQVFEPSGDYWLSHYTGFKLGHKISDESFKIRTTGKTKVVRPQ